MLLQTDWMYCRWWGAYVDELTAPGAGREHASLSTASPAHQSRPLNHCSQDSRGLRFLCQIRRTFFSGTSFRTLTLRLQRLQSHNQTHETYDTFAVIIPDNCRYHESILSDFKVKVSLWSRSCSYFPRSSGHCRTDDTFRCALRQWEMGVVKPGGTVSSRRLLLDIRVIAFCFISAI